MATPTVIAGDAYVAGNLSCQTLTPPAGSITDAAVQAAALIQATKLVHQAPGAQGACVELFGPAVTVAALTKSLGMAYATGTLIAFQAWIEVQATGADRTVNVDLQKSTGGGAYATVLSATVAITNATVIRTIVSGTINTAAYVAGDIFRAVVTVAGSASAQATGLSCRLICRENPQ